MTRMREASINDTVEGIIGLVVKGDIPIEVQFSESECADKLHFSDTETLQEALAHLVVDGIVRALPSDLYQVQQVYIPEAVRLMQSRALAERSSVIEFGWSDIRARLRSKKGNPTFKDMWLWVAGILDGMEQIAASGEDSVAPFLRADARFRFERARAALGWGLLATQIQVWSNRLRVFRAEYPPNQTEMKLIVARHKEAMSMIEDNDSRRAAFLIDELAKEELRQLVTFVAP